MKNLLVFLLLIFSVQALQAQFGEAKPADIKKVKRLPLIVITEVPWDKQVKKLKKKPAELERYEAAIDQYNEDFRKAVEMWWTHTERVEFMTWEEAKKMSYKSDKSHAVLYCSRYTLGSSNFVSANGLKWKAEYDERPLDEYFFSMHVRMRLQFIGEFANYHPLVEVNLPNRMPGPMELSFGLNAIQKGMEAIEVEKKWGELLPTTEVSAPQLAASTLLIQPLRAADGKYLAAIFQKVKKTYPFPMQEVSTEEMYAAIAGQEASKAYFVLTPIPGIVSTYESWMVDAATGQILSWSTVKAGLNERDVTGTLIEILGMLRDLK